MIHFIKTHAGGNEFILLRSEEALSQEQIAHLCDREKGIGADGLLIISDSSFCDYKMRIFNADGREAEMCGNGLRCVGAYLHQRDQKNNFLIETKAGARKLKASPQGVTIDFGPPRDFKKERISFNGVVCVGCFVNTGVPHLIFFEEDLKEETFNCWAPLLRTHLNLNVNYVCAGFDQPHLRTFERGVERESPACGTGAAAAAAALWLIKGKKISELRFFSGEVVEVFLDVQQRSIGNIYLTGSAELLFEGDFSLTQKSSIL